MTDYDCKTNGHHWIDHPEDGRFCFYCDEKYDFVQLYNRIEKLEAALRTVKEWHGYGLPLETTRIIDAALEGKDDVD